MCRALFVVLVLLIVNVNLSAQQLQRQSDGELVVRLSEMPQEIYACPLAKKMTVVLFEKINKLEEKTCSGKNTWDKVMEVVVDREKRALFSQQKPGTYKAEIEVKYDCSASSLRSVAQLITTNMLQENQEEAAVKKVTLSQGILIYPNPSLDKFILNVEDEGLETMDYTLKVYGANGALLFEKNVPYATRQNFAIDMKAFPSGQYTFSIWQADQLIGNTQAFKINQ